MRLVATLIALAALAPNSADTLVFGPEAGAKVKKTFEMTMQLDQQSISVSIAGNDLPEELSKDSELSFESTQRIVVEDEYREVGDERADLLARQYVELVDKSEQRVRMMGMPETEETTTEKESALEGESVLFRWNAKDDAYDKEWIGEGAADDLLEELDADMDFVALLPSKSPAVGDSWKVDMQDVQALFGPGGDLGFVDPNDEDDDQESKFQDNLTGELNCTFKGIEEEGDRKLARIAVVGKAKTSDEQMQGDTTQIYMDFELSLEGEVMWDVTAKRLASFKLTGPMTSDMKVTQPVEMENGSADLIIRVVLAGTVEIEADFAAP